MRNNRSDPGRVEKNEILAAGIKKAFPLADKGFINFMLMFFMAPSFFNLAGLN